MTFLKAIVAEYLRLLGVSYEDTEGVLWNINETPTSDEFENSFVKVERAKSSGGFVDKSALQMNGRLTRCKPCRILHFKMDANRLHEVARAHGATVTVYLLSLMFEACSASTDELTGEINIQVPINMRRFYPSRTVRNFSLYCGVRIPIDKIGTREETVAECARQLVEKAEREKLHEMVTAAVGIVSAIRLIPLVIKQPVAKIVYGFLGEKLYTTTFSNLGVVKMPEGFEKFSFFGYGPHESYIDKNLSTYVDKFETTVTDNFEHYVRPQENSSHYGTKWAEVRNADGIGLYCTAENFDSFSVNAQHFTPNMLRETKHDYELEALKETVFSLDYKQLSCGSASCGPKSLDKYRLLDKEFNFTFRLLAGKAE
jgi:hypothetical protein